MNKKTIWIIVAVLALIALYLGVRFYQMGYRLSLAHGISSPGTIEIHNYDAKSTYYLDGDALTKISNSNGVAHISAAAGNHELSVAKDGFYPWQKSFSIEAKETIVFDPFAVPSATSGVVLPKEDAEYKQALSAIATTTVPSEAHPIVSGDGSMELYMKDTTLYAKVLSGKPVPQYFCDTECKDEHMVIALQAEVRGISFMPGRDDVVLLAVGSSIFALELDTRSTQNFEPVYQGIRPSFGIGSNYLYIKDADSVFIVSLTPKNS
jgi:hypothetical protein